MKKYRHKISTHYRIRWQIFSKSFTPDFILASCNLEKNILRSESFIRLKFQLFMQELRKKINSEPENQNDRSPHYKF